MIRTFLPPYALWLLGAATLGLVGAAACGNGFETTGSGASGAGGGGSSSTGSGGGHPACADPVDGEPVEDGCGVFVSDQGSNDGDGSMAKPFRTLTDAIASGSALPIYACGTFAEAVSVDAPMSLWGGFDCPSWVYHQTHRTTLAPAAGDVPLTAKHSAHSIDVHNFSFEAEAAQGHGSSAIAVTVDGGVRTQLTDCGLAAGDGRDGADGKPGLPGEPGVDGESGVGVPNDACPAGGTRVASHGGKVTCMAGTAMFHSQGGDGGLGGPSSTSQQSTPAQAGTDGMSSGGGADGLGGGGGDSANICYPGGDAGDGQPGEPGKGGTLTDLSLGVVSGGEGYGALNGDPGRAGGGGGGNRGGNALCGFGGPLPGAGPSGGGGGSGSCGGAPGGDSQAGGSSIALLSLSQDVTLTRVHLTVGRAGRGGAGAMGGPGGEPGKGAAGGAAVAQAEAACKGGDGGRGGDGGPSGGARGGHAVGMAFWGAPPSSPDASFAPGLSGPGGTGAAPNSDGADGQSEACWDFYTDAPCPG